jgi:hypothetical protein
MKKLDTKQVLMGITGFLVTWQATNFDLDYRAILSSLVASGLAGAAPKKKAKKPVA